MARLDAILASQRALGGELDRLRHMARMLRNSKGKIARHRVVLLKQIAGEVAPLAAGIGGGLVQPGFFGTSNLPTMAETLHFTTMDLAKAQRTQRLLHEVTERLNRKLARQKHEIKVLERRIKKLQADETAAKRAQQAALSMALAPARGYNANPGVAPTKAARIALNAALAQVGKPYVWGAAGPNAFDCSGLLTFAWAKAGIGLPHSSAEMARVTKPIPFSKMRPGDLIFYYHPVEHVAMYIGNGQMIEAPHTGAFVRVVPARTADLAGVGRV